MENIIAKKNILFFQGVADDGMVRYAPLMEGLAPSTRKVESYSGLSNASMIRRFIPGSLDHFEYTNLLDVNKEVVLLISDLDQPIKFQLPDLIVNCIVDPDSSLLSLIRIDKIHQDLQKRYNMNPYIINHPSSVVKTRRNSIYEQFYGMPGIYIPKVIRVSPKSVAEFAKMIKIEMFKMPILVRPAGSHGGDGLQIIYNLNTTEELLKLEQYAYDGRPYYVTEWVDFQSSSDGLYRKSRIAIVDGKIMPRHRFISDDWNVHAKCRHKTITMSEENRQKEEEDYIHTPIEQTISSAAYETLKIIHQTLGLDYFGVDCHIKPNGDLLIFEINSAFHMMHQAHREKLAYLLPAVDRVIKTFNDMLSKRLMKNA